jgi:hypothetical protein
MKRAILPATAAFVASLVICARAEEAGASAPAGDGAGKPTSGRSSTPPPAAAGQRNKTGSKEAGNHGWGLDWGVGSGAGSTGMRGHGK